MAEKIGKNTIRFNKKVYIRGKATIVGPREKQGPLGEYFTRYEPEDFGEDTWEKGEGRFAEETIKELMASAEIGTDAIDCIFSGDLLNQCTASAKGAKNLNIPYLGLYGACSTMAESLLIGSSMIDGGGMKNVICMTSSNFCAAEKQFRSPLELGSQKPPTAQCTVTAAGAVLISDKGPGPVITSITPGIITDYGVTDSGNMGAAMAPAAASTIIAHFNDTGKSPEYYDMIFTGDLGITGMGLLKEILMLHGININNNYNDCGAMIFDGNKQGTYGGGSGCGCSAAVLTAYILRAMEEKKLNKVLFIATGALMSPVTVKQKDTVMGIAHCVAIENM